MHRRWLLWGQSLIDRGGAWVFAPFSWIWAALVFCKNSFYRFGWLRGRRVPCTVVSVGNLVAGGTGKTPFVHLLAKTFSHRKVAILSRGYGDMPDEAMLLQKRLPEVNIYIGKDRTASAFKAVADGAELILLEDGFQHRKLHRDFDIVLLDGQDPFGKNHFLPQGYLRDHPARLKEADAVFAKGIDFSLKVTRILSAKGEWAQEDLQGSFGIFCGIGNPRSFKKIVEDLGCHITEEWVLADHEVAPLQKLLQFSKRCKALGAKGILTTEKDFIKLPISIELFLPIAYIEVELRTIHGLKRWENLIEKIDWNIENRRVL